MQSPRAAAAPQARPRSRFDPKPPTSNRPPFDRTMWLERARLKREAEYVEHRMTELMGMTSLLSPRYRGKEKLSYEAALSAAVAKREGGEHWREWLEAQEANLTTREFSHHRPAPRVAQPLLWLAQTSRPQSARTSVEMPAVRAYLDYHQERAATPGSQSARGMSYRAAPDLKGMSPRQAQREAQIRSLRKAAPLFSKGAAQWAMQSDTADDEHAPVTEPEMWAAVKLIRSKLVRRGMADHDRLRRHLRRCDEGKGYLNKRTTVPDTFAVLNTLSLRQIRKMAWMDLINRFIAGPDEVGDKESCVKYDELLNFLMDGADRGVSFGDLGGPARPPGS